MQAAVDPIVQRVVVETLDGQFRETNQYGEPRGEPRTLRELVAERARQYMTEQVDANGVLKSPAMVSEVMTNR